ncbi:MAG: porin family protein [Gammaproteobacteria bacterium]|nr:porin family protein [Gammaproteobacteria bacterium]
MFNKEVVIKSRSFHLVSAFALLILASTSQADLRPVASLSLGLDQAYIGLKQNAILLSDVENTYMPGANFSTRMLSGGFLGVETTLAKNWGLQLGAAYYQSQPFAISGQVYQFMNPAYNSINYQYQIFSRRFLAESKLFYTFYQRYHPYLVAGLGEAFNYAYAYQETTSDVYSQTMAPFAGHMQHSFTYALGTGMDIDLTQRFKVGAGYRYVNLGKASLGTSPWQTTSQTPSFGHLYANEFLLQFTSYLN